MYSTHHEEKFVVAERFITTLKNENYKHMTSMSKNVYIDKLDEWTYTTIHIIPVDVNPSMYFDVNKEKNKEGPKWW